MRKIGNLNELRVVNKLIRSILVQPALLIHFKVNIIIILGEMKRVSTVVVCNSASR